jgi:hypothetical protein
MLELAADPGGEDVLGLVVQGPGEQLVEVGADMGRCRCCVIWTWGLLAVVGAHGAGRVRPAGEAVVLGEVAQLGAVLPEHIGRAARGLLGDALVLRPRPRA